MAQDITRWLAGLGMERYAPLFAANDIDSALLVRLTAQDLQAMGVASLGHRLRILDGVAGLNTPALAPLALAPMPPPMSHRTGRAQTRSYTPRHLSERILQSRSAMEGERKQVSVLFADVQGSMELAAQLDPEQWHAVLEGFFAILTDGVHRFEGTVNQYTGDGIMALFGAPIAHEDHAQRACFAALHLQAEIARYATEVRREHGVGFSTRMGINSGEVVVGRIGDDLRMDYTAQGHTVGLAQRMESLAEPNSCYLAPATAALAAGYLALEDLGEFRVKGVAERVRVHRLAGPGDARSRFDVSRRRGLSEFVGRASDLRMLDDALERASLGEGQVLGVVAQAGTGKSRLCFEFLERCRARGMRVIAGQAVAHGRHIAMLPVLELFRSLLGVGAQDDARSAREKIAGRVVLADPGLAGMLPLLFDFLSVADPATVVPERDPQVRQRQLVALMLQMTRAAPCAPPVVMVIEDLHWLDEASALFVEQLVVGVGGGRNLLLLNFRPEFEARWMECNWYRSIALTPLGPQAMAELVAGWLGSDPGILALAPLIHARSGGNPFFAEEIMQTLIESGRLSGERGACRLTGAIERLDMPATVQAVLAARIDRLPEREKRLLQVAAVIGKDFAEPLLAAVAGLEEEPLRGALQTLRRGEFVQALSLFPVPEYAFKHPLTQEAALAGQLRERRRELHACVARAIALQDASLLDERSALLAHHWDEAGDAWNAAQWHQRAAQWPGCPDFATAIRHWERVRSVLREAPLDARAAAMRINACTRLLTLGQRVGTDADQARALLEEGQSLAEQTGDRIAHLRLGMAFGWSLVSAGDVAGCLEMLAALQPRLDEVDDPALKVAAFGNMVLLNCFAARFERALALVAQGQALVSASAPAGKGLGSLDAAATLCQFEGFALGWVGRLAEAFDAYARCLRMADEVGELAVYARCHLAELHYLARDPQGALENALQAQQVNRQLGEPAMLHGRVCMALACAHLAGGRSGEAVAAARVAVDLHRGIDQVQSGASALFLAEALLLAGDLDAALAAAGQALARCRHSVRANYEALAHGVVARALLRRDGAKSGAVAQVALEDAARLIARTGARLLAPALARWRAELAVVQGDEPARQQWLDAAVRADAAIGLRSATAG